MDEMPDPESTKTLELTVDLGSAKRVEISPIDLPATGGKLLSDVIAESIAEHTAQLEIRELKCERPSSVFASFVESLWRLPFEPTVDYLERYESERPLDHPRGLVWIPPAINTPGAANVESLDTVRLELSKPGVYCVEFDPATRERLRKKVAHIFANLSDCMRRAVGAMSNTAANLRAFNRGFLAHPWRYLVGPKESNARVNAARARSRRRRKYWTNQADKYARRNR